MKKTLLFSAFALALGLTAQAADQWALAGAFKSGTKTYTNPGTPSSTNTLALIYDETSGAYTATIDFTGFFKVVNLDADAVSAVKAEYSAEYPSWNPSTWHTQVGASVDGGGVTNFLEEASPLQLVDFKTLNKAKGYSPGGVRAACSATNVKVEWYPATQQVRVIETPSTVRTYATYGIVTDGTKAPTADTQFTTPTDGSGIFTGTYDFGETEGVKTFYVRPTSGTYATYGFASDESDAVIGSADPVVADGVTSYTCTLTPYHAYQDGKRNPGNPSMTVVQTPFAKAIKANLTGKWNVKFDANSCELTFSQVAEVVEPDPVPATVTWEYVGPGKNDAGTATTLNPGKGVKMTYDEQGGYYTCHLAEVTGGFKIINDDQSVIDHVTANFNGGVTTWAAGQWHTMHGANIYGGDVVDLSFGAEPTELVDFITLNGNTGHSPGEVTFAGGVKVATDVTVKWWPETKMVLVTGTPTEYKEFAIVDGTTGWAVDPEKYHLKHVGDGIYEGNYTFVYTEGVLKNTFKVRPVDNTKPTYGFKDGEETVFGEPVPTEVKSRATVSYTQTLTPYHIDSEKRREAGVASGTASITGNIAHSAKSTLVGDYAVRFDANTGDMTLSGEQSSTGIELLINNDMAPVEYYNMQGVRVEAPARGGVYVRRQGTAVTKVIL